MLRLVSELPGLFRHGRTELQLSGAPGGEAPLQKQCAERIKGLEELVSNLEPQKMKKLLSSNLCADQGSTLKPLWRDFLQAVPDDGLDLSGVWATARSFKADEDPDGEQDVQDLALLAIWRRCFIAQQSLLSRLRSLDSISSADLAILKPSLKAELHILKGLLAAVAAGPSGAEAMAARALANRATAEAKCAAAAAAAQSLVLRGRRGPPRGPAPPAPGAAAPVEPPSSTVEGIQRWLQSVRQTGSVAASASEGDWKRQLEVLRAGLTGTAVCLGSDPPSPGPTSPSSLGPLRSLSECAICLELLPSRLDDGVIPLPCGHRFHSACASQWLQKCPRCPVCRHSPFMPAPELKGRPTPPAPHFGRPVK